MISTGLVSSSLILLLGPLVKLSGVFRFLFLNVFYVYGCIAIFACSATGGQKRVDLPVLVSYHVGTVNQIWFFLYS